MGVAALLLAGLSYLVAVRLAWVAIALGLSGHCEEVVVGLGHRIVNTTCHSAAVHANNAVASWLAVSALLLLAFLAVGLGSGLAMWCVAIRARRTQRAS